MRPLQLGFRRVARSVAPLALTVATTSLGGCSGGVQRHLLIRDSMPSRLAALESPATLPQGSVAVLGMGGGRVHGEKPIGEPGFRTGQAWGGGRVRVGVVDALELSATGFGGRWRMTSSLCRDEERDGDFSLRSPLWGARGGFKLAPRPIRDFMAVTGGVGGGMTRAGSHVSPDIGVAFGWERGPVVPFAHLSLLGSIPLRSRTFFGVDCGNDVDSRILVDFEPTRRIMGQGTFGMKFPVPEFGGRGRGYTLLQFYVAMTIDVSDIVSGGMVGGIELVFGSKPSRPDRRRRMNPGTPAIPQPAPTPAPRHELEPVFESRPVAPEPAPAAPAPAPAAAPAPASEPPPAPPPSAPPPAG